ncbi:hypothetical protein [Klebsiella michiganensis]|uniref:hypothetical protein n=1 Tax=Klebsiella michiganensis TaxID=1134687 RepID=UPI0012B9B919|nr:hypothetical protein [Klebsiella michiganensis]
MLYPLYKNGRLHESVLIPFNAYHAEKSKVLWANIELFHEYGYLQDKHYIDEDCKSWIIGEFSYVTDEQFSNSNQRIFYAERYGGEGIDYNGGGGRTGLYKNFQIKGIGSTPLISYLTSVSYKNGRCGLAEVIKDAIWGEVGNIILPHGAARCFALLEIECPVSETKRFLSVRENLVRPAHFMRAPYFKPKGRFENNSSDGTRVLKNKEALNFNLYSISKSSNVIDGLHIMYARWAEQVAFTQAHRLFHGALTPSNICLDGKWIDFGTMSSIGRHCNVIIARGKDPFWMEPNSIAKIIDSFLYNANKYYFQEPLDYLSEFNTFKTFYDFYAKINILRALGIRFIKDYNPEFTSQVNSLTNLIYTYLHINSEECFFGIPLFDESTPAYKIHTIILGLVLPTQNIEKHIIELITKLESRRIITIQKTSMNYDFLNVDVIEKEIDFIESISIDYESVVDMINQKVFRAKEVFHANP